MMIINYLVEACFDCLSDTTLDCADVFEDEGEDQCSNYSQEDCEYLDYCEYFSLLPHGEREKLRAEEVSTKDAALHMLNEWKLGLFFINSNKTNGPPPIATIALQYLIHTARGNASPMDKKGGEKIRELNKSEKDLWTTALSLLRNWFNHDIELT